MAKPPYTLEFYADELDDQPVRRWLKEELDLTQRQAIGVAMSVILQHEGINVCKTPFGRQLGDGLFEFRLDQDADEILGRTGTRSSSSKGKSKILLRVFCHAHGNKIILLLGGYDKLRSPAKSHQQKQIAVARARLSDWKRRHR